MKNKKHVLLGAIICIVVVSFNIQTVSATTMIPPYDDGNSGVYYGMHTTT
ncbi:MAG: hypothetical protein RTU30_11675 [Candidatus Thorarchaeota archaeon]